MAPDPTLLGAAKPQTLDTPRLWLRAIALTDSAFLHDLLTNPQTRHFLGGPLNPERCAATVATWLNPANPDLIWCVTRKDTHQPIGLTFLSRHTDTGQPELSYQFHPKAWGQGFAFEATSRLLHHAATDLHLGPIIAETQSANHASRRLLIRLGLTEHTRLQRFGAEQILYRSTNQGPNPPDCPPPAGPPHTPQCPRQNLKSG